MDYTSAFFDTEILWIRMRRYNRIYRIWKLLLFFMLCSLILVLGYRIIPQEMPNIPWLIEKLKYFPDSIMVNLVILFLIVFFMACFLRRRYLGIDRRLGLIYYSRSILGTSSYYFAEVKQIESEIDVSQILAKLSSRQFFRIYFRFHNNKHLLISEEISSENSQNLCQRLQKIFNVEIKSFQKLADRRSGKIQLGDYSIIKEISHGGMGKIFLAKDLHNQIVALKILPSELASQSDCLNNFLREIRILKKLSHPGIIKLLSVGRDTSQNVYFYAMEYIEGETLSSFLKKSSPTLEQLVIIVMQAAFALGYLHHRKIIHRDIKPNNIMIRNTGQVVLIDFGIACDTSRIFKGKTVIETPDGFTHSVGTLPYMSPEQLSNKDIIDYRTDIYSLGVTLYEMITKQLPYNGNSQTMYRLIMTGTPAEPREINPNISIDLNTITMRAIEKNPKKRYQSADDFASDLHRWIRGLPIASRPVGKLSRVWRTIKSWIGWIWIND